MTTNVLQFLEKTTSLVPKKLAFVDEVNSIDYEGVLFRAKQIGSVIIRKFNGDINKPIVVFVDRNIESIVAFLGVAYSGNFYVPIDANTMPNLRIKLILDTLKPSAVIVPQKALSITDELASNLIVIKYSDTENEPINETSIRNIRSKIIDRDPCYATFTSGSTGIPKGVVTCHQSVIDMTEALVETFAFDGNHVFGNQNPFYFDASIKDIYSSIRCGSTLYIIPKSLFISIGDLVDYLNRKRIDTIMWSASAIALLANAKAFEDEIPSYLRKVMFSGEVMHNRVLNYWRKHLPNTLFVNLYGPTEITSVCTYYKIQRPFADDEVLPIGKAFRNCEVMLLNENNELAKEGEIGEICVKGCCLALGYYNNPEKTAEAFCQNPMNPHYPELIYRTGDLAKHNEDGEIMFLSRKDNQVKHMGQRVELGEIEILLNSFEKIDASISFYDHENQKIIAVYKGDGADSKYIYSELKDRVSKFMFPNVLVRLEELPYNVNGKIDRTLLKDKYFKGELS